ncbi:unnamed protein product [Sphagnum balticum]
MTSTMTQANDVNSDTGRGRTTVRRKPDGSRTDGRTFDRRAKVVTMAALSLATLCCFCYDVAGTDAAATRRLLQRSCCCGVARVLCCCGAAVTRVAVALLQQLVLL